jgi:hypothetical protein
MFDINEKAWRYKTDLLYSKKHNHHPACFHPEAKKLRLASRVAGLTLLKVSESNEPTESQNWTLYPPVN